MQPTSSLGKVKGVGPATLKQFEKAGLFTIDDLIEHYPRRYEDFSAVTAINKIVPGKVTLKARVESVSTRHVRRGMTITTAVLADNDGKTMAVWFNQAYRAKQLGNGGEFYFTGNYEFQYNRFQLNSPSVTAASELDEVTDEIMPIYPLKSGIKRQTITKTLRNLRPLIKNYSEYLPSSIVKMAGVVSQAEALEKIHFPKNRDDIKIATERLSFNELFELTLASQLNKQENARLTGWQIPFNLASIKKLIGSLPYKLTDAQRKAIWEIVQDFNNPHPMNRLLQGDVGSGKTVVAGLTAAQAAKHGLQTAILAPTDILATQHAKSLQEMLSAVDVKVGLLTGRVKGEARRIIYQQIATGGVDVVVGTHALIQEALEFKKLGYVVIDEQHRFGVKQRQALLEKSEHLPHLLSMTATPIPRSLALTVYGELEVSILDELPGGRKPIETKIWSPNSTESLFGEVQRELDAGRQAYYICSLIEEGKGDGASELKNTEKQYKLLQNKYFKNYKVGMLHGKMKPQEKQAVMEQFLAHELDILVSTTVVEVGVDVPNATVIMIENADRFGLAQLHQLRGRVGRGGHQSYAYLIYSDSKKPSRRLRELESSNDGFYLAEVDLKLRGPGEIYGHTQHGDLNLKIATLSSVREIVRVRKIAEKFIASDEGLSNYPKLEKRVKKYQRITTLN